MESLVTKDNIPITHVYSFNKRMSEDDNFSFALLINNSPNVQMVIWSIKPKKTTNFFGLKNF